MFTPCHSAPRRIVVGYTANERGFESLALAATIAAGTDAEIVITFVLQEASPYTPLRNEDPILQQRVGEWEKEALERVPEGVRATAQVRSTASQAEGLLDAAAEHAAGLIVIGARRSALLQQFALGRTANALLHSSPVPVALAPPGYRFHGNVPRVTAAYGTRPGAEAVIGTAVELADELDAPMRLLSLLASDKRSGLSSRLISEVERFGGDALSDRAGRVLGTDTASIDIVEGGDLDEAADRATWLDGELALIGSSRLAPRGRVFIGGVAQRLLRSTSAALIVIPREYRAETNERTR